MRIPKPGEPCDGEGFLERAGTASETRGRGGGVGFDATLGGREPMTWRPTTTVWCLPTLFLDQCTMDTAGTDKLYHAWCLESICAPRKLALRGGCQEIWGTVSLDGTARCDWRRTGVVCSFGVCVSMESGPWPSQHHKQTKPRAEKGARKCNEGEEREGTAQMDGKSG